MNHVVNSGTGSLSGDGLPTFLQAEQLNPFISEELRLATTPIVFRFRTGQRAAGYDAMLLPMICEVYLNLRDSMNARLRDNSKDGQAKASLRQYGHIIEACDGLVRELLI